MRRPPSFLSKIGQVSVLAGSALLTGIVVGLPGGLSAADLALALRLTGFLGVFVLVQPPADAVLAGKTQALPMRRRLVLCLVAVAVALPAWHLAVAWVLGPPGAEAGAGFTVLTALVYAAVGVVLVLVTWGVAWRRARRGSATGWGGPDAVA